MEELGRITSVELQKKNKSRVSVFLDGTYLGSAEDIVWVHSGLKVGDVLTAACWEDLQTVQEARAAFDKALTHLTSRARSRLELERYLTEKGFSQEAVNSALAKLESYGYIDDGEFAAMLVRDRMNVKPQGRRAIAGELKRLGVQGEEAETALAQYGQEDELSAAMKQAEKDMKRTAGETDERKRRSKIYASLARRGFSHDLISEAINSLFKGPGDD
jgi:regulatory protein